MNRMHLIVTIASFSCMTCASARIASRSDVQPTTLCTVADHVETYSGKQISVNARAITDVRHITLLQDETCLDRRIALQFPTGHEHRSVATFRDALFAGDPVASPNRRVTARFTGTVKSQPGKIPSRLLVLQRVEDLRITE
jgi:hypothetical protein